MWKLQIPGFHHRESNMATNLPPVHAVDGTYRPVHRRSGRVPLNSRFNKSFGPSRTFGETGLVSGRQLARRSSLSTGFSVARDRTRAAVIESAGEPIYR